MGWKPGDNIYPELAEKTLRKIKNFRYNNKYAEIIFNKQGNGTDTVIKISESASILKRMVRKEMESIPVYPSSKIVMHLTESSLFSIKETVCYRTVAIPKVVIHYCKKFFKSRNIQYNNVLTFGNAFIFMDINYKGVIIISELKGVFKTWVWIVREKNESLK